MNEILVALREKALTLSIARPAKRNSLNTAMYDALSDGLDRAADDPEIRVVTLRGEGAHFCAGNDIGDFLEMNASSARGADAFRALTRFIRSLAALEKPIVAAAQGHIVGVGVTMLLNADMVYLADDASLSMPFADLGLSPGGASSILLPQCAGHARAFAMFVAGAAITGREAAEFGLANAALPAADIDQAAALAAREIAQKPPASLRAIKRLMRDPERRQAIVEAEIATFEERLRSPEAREAFAAFAEKRRPDFTRFG